MEPIDDPATAGTDIPGGRAARIRAPLGVALVVLLVLLAGCGGKSGSRAAAPGSSTTSSTAPVTFPLTGLPTGGAAIAARPALSVKIDNIGAARPQAGLNTADIVVEEPVEGGLTRLFATWQSKDAGQIGPVRSARPVDALLLRQLGPSLFAFAGASAGVLQVVRRDSGATLIDPSSAPDAFQRASGRSAPHNTFSSTAALYAAGRRAAAKLAPPRAFLTFAATPSGAATPVRVARMTFSQAARAAWQWNGSAFVRYQNGTLDRLTDGNAVSATNVVVMRVAVRPGANVDVLGHPTPDPVLTGTGRVWIMRDGKVVEGTWRRVGVGSPVELVGADGKPLPLRPGRTWIELLPNPRQPSFSP
ncbi:MAG TPA: DUF3048 domain-containing protein [Actinomycetes bacterium]|jgi:hypothetical protein|nr:DUF3048 domain-containing protein [Actinomycetes bacterium]